MARQEVIIIGKDNAGNDAALPVSSAGGMVVVGKTQLGVELPLRVDGNTSRIEVSIPTGTNASPTKQEDVGHSSGDMGMYVLGVRAPATPVSPTSAAGDYGSLMLSAEGKQIVVGQGAEEHQWQANTALTTTTDVALKSAAGAGVRNYLTDLTLDNTGGTAVRAQIKDGSTVLWTGTVPANGTLDKQFKTPLRTGANATLNIALFAAGTVNASAQGYIGL
ncbi:hypothetical protein SEA_WESAK_37 [Microbacterium phage Wesak]|uniref:Uncharacterized protein n=1 Tax=Microbacterium phage Wesak TaxID=2653751 RepID=A0A5Q2WLC1_9CAUD|nr:hypothetical protein SEA_WESAK_37 [Microbacterium phage Wesak]